MLGIDPGLTRCGLGCVDVDPRRQVRLVEVGVVRTPPSQSPELRLLAITEAIEDWIARLGPSVVSIERVFAQDNLRSEQLFEFRPSGRARSESLRAPRSLRDSVRIGSTL